MKQNTTFFCDHLLQGHNMDRCYRYKSNIWRKDGDQGSSKANIASNEAVAQKQDVTDTRLIQEQHQQLVSFTQKTHYCRTRG